MDSLLIRTVLSWNQMQRRGKHKSKNRCIIFYREWILTLTFPAHKTYTIVLNKAPKILYKARRNICQKGQVNESCKNGHMLMLVWTTDTAQIQLVNSAVLEMDFYGSNLTVQPRKSIISYSWLCQWTLLWPAAFLFCPIKRQLKLVTRFTVQHTHIWRVLGH